MVHAKVVFPQRIRVLLHFGIRAGFSFKRKMASRETNDSVTPEMENTLENSITIQNLVLEIEELKRAKERSDVKLAMLETNMVKEPMKCKPADPEKFKEGGRVRIQAWLGVMENYLHAGNTSPDFWVDIAQTYLEVRVAQNWQNAMRILEREGKNPKEWLHFKEALTKAYGNVNPEQVARSKLGKLSQHSSVESYANEFQNLCAEIVTLPMSVGDKIHRFIDGLKPEIRLKVAVDPLNDAQPWEDFQRLVTYAVSVDANLQQVKAGLGIATTKNGEKKTPSIGVGGPIRNQKKSTMKFTNGREIDYKRVAALKKEGKCYFCEEKGHRVNTCPKKSNSTSDKVEKDF